MSWSAPLEGVDALETTRMVPVLQIMGTGGRRAYQDLRTFLVRVLVLEEAAVVLREGCRWSQELGHAQASVSVGLRPMLQCALWVLLLRLW